MSESENRQPITNSAGASSSPASSSISEQPVGFSERFTNWIGSVGSLVAHTVFFSLCFVLILFGFDSDKVMLILTTAVSLEAIYLAIFIQMTVNRNTQSLKIVEENIDEIQEDIDEIQEDIDEIQEDVDEIQEDIDEIQEDVNEIQEDIDEIQEDIDEIQEEEEEEEEEVSTKDSILSIEEKLQKIMQELEKMKSRPKKGD